MFFRKFFVLPVSCVYLLSACGGSSGIPPVLADGALPPANLSGFTGHVFPVEVATMSLNGGVTQSLAIQVYGIEITSPTTAVLQTDLGTVDLTEAGGTWTGSVNGWDFALETADFFGFPTYSEVLDIAAADAGGNLRFGAGVFGFQTPASAIQDLVDLNIGASYSGEAVLLLSVAGAPTSSTGTSNLVIQFGAGTVTGTIFGGTDTDLNVVNGVVSTSGVSGDLAIDGPPGVTASLNPGSSFDGNFYGNSGFEVSGTMQGTGELDGDPLEFVGVFAVID